MPHNALSGPRSIIYAQILLAESAKAYCKAHKHGKVNNINAKKKKQEASYVIPSFTIMIALYSPPRNVQNTSDAR